MEAGEEEEEEIGEQLIATIVEDQDLHSRFLQVWLTDWKIQSLLLGFLEQVHFVTARGRLAFKFATTLAEGLY